MFYECHFMTREGFYLTKEILFDKELPRIHKMRKFPNLESIVDLSKDEDFPPVVAEDFDFYLEGCIRAHNKLIAYYKE